MTMEHPHVTILTYHDILPPGSPPNGFDGSISFDRFRDHLDALEREGFRNIPLEGAFDRLMEGSAAGEEEFFAVTFDDGYERLHRYLPPFLTRITPSLFVLTGEVGKENHWNMRSPARLEHLALGQLRELAEWGVEMELHGTDHSNVARFSADELRERWEEGILWLAEKVGVRPRYVAYPYGSCNETAQKVAAGLFRGALSVNHGHWAGKEARFALNRISVPFFLTGDDLVAVIRAAPENRWYETETRAPWRQGRAR